MTNYLLKVYCTMKCLFLSLWVSKGHALYKVCLVFVPKLISDQDVSQHLLGLCWSLLFNMRNLKCNGC